MAVNAVEPHTIEENCEVPVESSAAVLQHYGVVPATGLSDAAALERLKQFGENRIRKSKGQSALTIFTRQFQGTVVILLIVAASISYVSHEVIQAIGIISAVVINAVIGFFAEWKAKISLENLEALAGPTAQVLRGGNLREIAAQIVVPGDIVFLDAGARVPADLRLIDTTSLSIDESPMTGESVPVYKSVEADCESGNEAFLAWQGTLVVSGRGVGVVVATGEETRLGRLGKLLTTVEQQRTPLEVGLEGLGKQLTVLISVMCVLLMVIGIWHHENVWIMIQTSIALAVAAIPEGMPVVATLALAVGTQRMVKAKALIRQLSAVETLGCTTVICSDKTGTLTENQMTVTELVCLKRHLKISGNGYEPKGIISEHGKEISMTDATVMLETLRAAALCNDAKLENHGDVGWHVHGDPTEGALITAAGKAGLCKDELLRDFPRVAEICFDLTRKRMSTLHRDSDDKYHLYVKGSPEAVLTQINNLSDAERQWIKGKNEELAARGLRVLAVAKRIFDKQPDELTTETVEIDLEFLGLVGMSDRPRPEVAAAIENCKRAGIKVIMVTGDHPTTAGAIAGELGLIKAEAKGDPILTGAELSQMNSSELRLALRQANVLARVTPELKLAVVNGLQSDGEIVAMTGDGVNDAPALRQANIGIAMGGSGTALAREASSMVITDDNFATVVKAVRQGRIIYDNIRKSIAYLLTASVASVICVLGCVLFDLGLAFTPLQLLWLNLIMHVFPGLGIVLQRGSSSVMNRPPRDKDESLIGGKTRIQILIRSVLTSVTVLAVLKLHLLTGGAAIKLSTVGLAALSLVLLLQAWVWAAPDAGEPKNKKFRLNWPMIINTGISFALLMVAIYVPPMQVILQTSFLSATEMLMLVAVSFVPALISSFISSCTDGRLNAVFRQ